MLRFITTADTEILATASAVRRLPEDFPVVRCANPKGTRDIDPFLDHVLDGARVVVIRVLGGRRGWQGGVDRLAERCREDGIALIALGGESAPDAEMTALSTVPSGAVATVGEYLQSGDVDNIEQLLRFLADTFLLEGFGFEEPKPVEKLGVYLPGRGDVTIDEALSGRDPMKPVVGITFYRSHRLTGNTDFIDGLCAAIERQGAIPVPVWAYTMKRDHAGGQVPALDLLRGRVDALITTMLATGGANAGDAAGDIAPEDGGHEEQMSWDSSALESLDVPVIQALCVTMSKARWAEGNEGLLPIDAATQVAIPEFDGRIIGGPISFKEMDDSDSPVGTAVPRYVPDAERCDRLAGLVVRHAKLRKGPWNDDGAKPRKIAIVLTAFPTKHARIGMAVGLDTPASAIGLLHRLRADGIAVANIPADGDALMHELIAAGGHDPEFLTDQLLQDAPLRISVSDYLDWYRTLPAELTGDMVEKWGEAPGDRYLDTSGTASPGGGDLVIAGVEYGDVVVLIQPPRGYGDDQVGIYHDPELAPAHHYMAAYRWLNKHWGADAIVHLGKHGTLEWLPGKMLALGESCAPDAALADMPLVYPFVVNDPGEGAQAKRRAHAVVVDHLVPPMMRAESYDELADLEALMDEYARLEVLDPSKLPGLGAEIWKAIQAANLHEDLGLDAEHEPDDAGTLVEHLDGYLCEVKDVQIKDGLHVLGVVPEGPHLRGLVAAIGRHGSGDVPGLRRAVAAAFGLDEEALVAAPGVKVSGERSAALLERFPGTAYRGSDLLDRLEEAQHALLTELSEHDWDVERCAELCRSVLGRDDAGVVSALRFAAGQIVPKLRATTDEMTNVLGALRGRHVPAGPSGAPTRGRFDVLPTGRNFYSVDPRALPSQLSFETGVKLADAVIERYVADSGELPEMVGLVAWGTAAMRTQGDDAAEVLALLGVRPTWHPASRRVTGLEVIPLEELGRPRIDVTLRISGFFRDAFPHLLGLLDDAVTMVAALDEPDEQNFVAKHARAEAAKLSGDLEESVAWRRATTRIFGSKPGTYGAGLIQLLETRDWRDDKDLAAVYEAWGGFAYGRGLGGVAAGDAMRACFERIDVAVKNVDSREHDHLDSDDYYQYHGGMVATIKALSGREPAAYLGDSSDPKKVKVRTLAEETRRVFRARVANPAWIGSMVRHGFKGAAELAATVDYLFGYDATTDIASDWMYETVAEKYLLDEDIAAFMDQANPWAARSIAERLLEAADRGLWAEPSAETVDAIKARYLSLEDALEGATA
ncbi:cobaltochelatase subunit CobN [Paraconexibacter antarcticus]|uniref:Cobaltochelatase subunit CobN n=1 Tax=Paraconexibacter antarcticus TaxID=2949664 RepID=A0ABY5DTY1_9ACTN|nr:cobaltochelatase subunit CobN [Paraconexibacter antarcticus]UTI64125.1 cobaltochelatase subunit CobN [Paraconexibacter antarcticus]